MTTLSTSASLLARMERLPALEVHRPVLMLLALGTFFDAYDALAIGSALTVISRTLHIDLVNAGQLISLGFAGQAVGAISFGVLSERWGRRNTFIAALIIMAVFSLASALAWDFRSLAVARFLLGIGVGAETPIAAALLAELLQGQRRGGFFHRLPKSVCHRQSGRTAGGLSAVQSPGARYRLACVAGSGWIVIAAGAVGLVSTAGIRALAAGAGSGGRG